MSIDTKENVDLKSMLIYCKSVKLSKKKTVIARIAFQVGSLATQHYNKQLDFKVNIIVATTKPPCLDGIHRPNSKKVDI